MTVSTNQPAVLFHGSPVRLTRLEPRPARGTGPATDQLHAIYAVASPLHAIPFALPIVSDEQGRCSWSMEFADAEPRIVLHVGRLDWERVGYLYRLPVATFTPIDEHQWVSYEPVTPLDFTVIRPRDYAHWVC